MSRRILTALLAATAISARAIAQAPAPQPRPSAPAAPATPAPAASTLPAGVVARVDGQAITEDDVKIALRSCHRRCRARWAIPSVGPT